MTNSVDPLMEERIQARSAPASWSWKDQGGVTSVKNQASCGSCAVFASVAAIDTCFWQVTGRLVDDLSEQHVMDCAYGYGYGNAGCDGGFMVSYMEWIKDENDGFVEMESCDPYTATDEFCTDDDSCNYGDAKVTGVYSSWSPNEPDMKEMVYLNPVGTAIYVIRKPSTFPPTFCSVFRPPTCSTMVAASTTTTGVAREPTDAT